jgi:hypothetical protein
MSFEIVKSSLCPMIPLPHMTYILLSMYCVGQESSAIAEQMQFAPISDPVLSWGCGMAGDAQGSRQSPYSLIPRHDGGVEKAATCRSWNAEADQSLWLRQDDMCDTPNQHASARCDGSWMPPLNIMWQTTETGDVVLSYVRNHASVGHGAHAPLNLCCCRNFAFKDRHPCKLHQQYK